MKFVTIGAASGHQPLCCLAPDVLCICLLSLDTPCSVLLACLWLLLVVGSLVHCCVQIFQVCLSLLAYLVVLA